MTSSRNIPIYDDRALSATCAKQPDEKMEFEITLDQLPATAGIDPLIKLIDRNPDDNMVAVEAR